MHFLKSGLARIIVPAKLSLQLSGDLSGLKGPAVILANHLSNIDWLAASYVLRRHPVRFVVGRYQFRNPVTAKAFTMLDCIPKEQFYPDMQTIKMIYRTMKDGGIVVLFPSGQSSYSGESTFVPVEVAKLLKKLSVPVYSLHIDGAHLAFPKWDMSKTRKHRIDVAFGGLFTKEELSALSEAEIYGKTVEALYYDDYEWQRRNMVPAKKNRSLTGIDHILFMCPVCGAEFQMQAEKDVLTCGACSHAFRSDVYGFLSPDDPACPFDTPSQWYRWQWNETAKQLADNPQYSFSEETQLTILSKPGKTLECHEGTLTFCEGVLAFREARAADPFFRLDVKLDPILFQHESIRWFELIHQNNIYRFEPKPKGASTKFVILKELYYLIEKRAAAPNHDMEVLYDNLLRKTI